MEKTEAESLTATPRLSPPASDAAALLAERDVARLLGCSSRTLQTWRCLNYGPRYVKVSGGRRGGAIRYRRGDVEAFLDERTVRTSAAPWSPRPRRPRTVEA